MSNTLTIHHQAEDLREQEKFFAALETYQQAINEYLQMENFQQVSSALFGMGLTYKHLYLKEDQTLYLVLAMGVINTGLSLAKELEAESSLTTGYHLKAEILQEQSNTEEAIKFFSKTLELYTQEDALKGRYLYHLGEAQYQAGLKEEGKQNLVKGLKMIQNHQEKFNQYTLDVWETGALLSLAEQLWENKPAEAEDYLEQAGKIIDKNPNLVIRKREYQKLKQQF